MMTTPKKGGMAGDVRPREAGFPCFPMLGDSLHAVLVFSCLLRVTTYTIHSP